MKRTIQHFNYIILRRAAAIAATLALALGVVNQGRASTVSETVTISSSPARTINPSFGGVSYEKKQLTVTGYFSATNTPLIDLFNMLGSGVLRIGGGTVDTTSWNGQGGLTPITSAQVDALAGFIKECPNWKVIYGINLENNTAANAVAEATYAKNALGSQLFGFEMGNEPEYYNNSTETYSQYLSLFRTVTATIISDGYPVVDADAGQGQLAAFTDPFANDEGGVVSQLTQHYYRGSSGDMPTLLQPDPFLTTLANNIASAAYTGGEPLGARISECGSYASGGVVGVSDAYGAAMWSLDFMFTAALNNVQGINFHGGGQSPYTPLYSADSSPSIISQVRPEFYGLKMFSLVPPGKVVSATVSPSQTYYTAYGVNCTSGGTAVLLNNKDTAKTMATTVNLGSDVASVALIKLTGSSWYATNGYTLGGAAIYPNGTWTGGVQSVLSAPNGQLTVSVPPYNAYLLNPVTVGSKPVDVKPGPNWNLRDTLNGGPANFSYHWGSSSDTHFFMGDWNGDGTMSPGIVRINSSGQWEWLLHNSNAGGGADYDFAYGRAEPGDVLVVGDWDGNGTWTPGIVRTNSSGQLEWMLRNANAGGGADYDFVYGDAGDTPFVGDWDGNGTFTPGCVKAGSNTWSLRNENSSGVADLTFAYGDGTGIPIVGDWDGNGTWTCGVIKGNTWNLRNSNSTGTAQIVFGYGSPGDAFLVWQ